MANSKSSATVDLDVRHAFDRREFLVLGSAAVACVATSSIAAAAARAFEASPTSAILSIGYADLARSADAGDMARVMASSASPSRDLRFVQAGAKLTVHGLFRPEARRNEPVSIRLSTFAPDPTEPPPFLAWAYSTDEQGRTNISRRLSFVAALDTEGAVPVAIERHEPVPASGRRVGRMRSVARGGVTDSLPHLADLDLEGNVCRLGGERGDVALRPGAYFIALRQSAGDRAPDWSSITVAANPENLIAGDGALRRGDTPVEFEYLALVVEYAV